MATLSSQDASLVGKSLRAEDLRVVEIDVVADPRWEQFVNSHPDSLVYHHPSWLQVLQREYDQKCLGLAVVGLAGEVQAGMPLLYTKGFPLQARNPSAGRRLSSLPRTPLAGPLSLRREATVALLREAVRRVQVERGLHLQMKVQAPELDNLVQGIARVRWRTSYVLQLPAASADIRFGNSSNHSHLKWAMKKAVAEGLRVRPAQTETDLRGWYEIYLDTMRRNAVPPRPYRFFLAIWNLLAPQGLMQLLLAESSSNCGCNPIAGLLLLKYKQTVSYAFGACCQRGLSQHANDLLHWEAIHEACRAGFRLYDFGEVPEGEDELARFKRKWNTQPVLMHRYYYPSPSALAGTAYPAGPLWGFAAAVWRGLPLKMTAVLGDWIYRYL